MSERAKRPMEANRWRWPLVGMALAVGASTAGCEGPGLEPPYSDSDRDAGPPGSAGNGAGASGTGGTGGQGGAGGPASNAGAGASGMGGAGGSAPTEDGGQVNPPDAAIELDGGDDEDAGATH